MITILANINEQIQWSLSFIGAITIIAMILAPFVFMYSIIKFGGAILHLIRNFFK